MKRGKGQYSLEFLITYGWALLIIGIVIGAIYTFGWVDASNFLPQRCTFYGQTTCRDFFLSEDNLSLSIVNNYGVNLNISGIELREDGAGVICSNNSQNIVWNRSEFAIVPLDLTSVSCTSERIVDGDRFVGVAIIEFFSPLTCPTGSVDCRHNTTGSIVARVQ